VIVHFADFCGIVDQHCLYFLFKIFPDDYDLNTLVTWSD